MDGFVCSEVHGNLEGFYYNSVKRKVDDSGKLSYIRARLKTPEAELQEHPLLRRSKCLRPLYAPVRFVKALIKRPGYLSKELRTLSQYKKNPEK